MKDLKHIFFDLDHTLWDFDANSKAALKELWIELVRRDLRHFDPFYRTYVEINDRLWDEYGRGTVTKEELRSRRFREALQAHGMDDPDLSVVLETRYVAEAPDYPHLMPGALDVLEGIRQQGLKIHILTNGFKETQTRKVRTTGLDRHIDSLITAEEAGYWKPDVRIFHFAMDRTGARVQDSIMIGDHPERDVLGARRLGMSQILVDTHDRYKEAESTHRVRQLLEILPILGIGTSASARSTSAKARPKR
ncbi:MAG: YjjG family noncanonical pyrimidine nucleotidase [Bacteroidota bacterium]|nr:YjjG family noncanonical pyrimidine nucleotidase [Bacteroidota bacterium]MDX5505151.1 YjjG family noncanonical pyrimidine nucleotidase [Bacteroidota bacterium]